jgi:hypothetical protein
VCVQVHEKCFMDSDNRFGSDNSIYRTLSTLEICSLGSRAEITSCEYRALLWKREHVICSKAK